MYKEKKEVLSNKSVFIALLIFFATVTTFGQDKKDNMLDKVKGNVEKITIQTDKGTVTFEGKDAKNLFGKMKSSEMQRIKIFKSGDDSDNDVFFISPDKMDGDFSFFGSDLKDGKKIEINIEKKDGEKELTVTTTGKDGKSNTETYKGKDADEYLVKHGHKKFDVKWLDKNDKKGNVFFFRKGANDSLDEDADMMKWNPDDSTKGFYIFNESNDMGSKKLIKVTDENGVKKVTVTTTDENGKEKTETYEGKDAEEYLEKNNVKVRVKVEGDKNGDVKEIIIRKKEKNK